MSLYSHLLFCLLHVVLLILIGRFIALESLAFNALIARLFIGWLSACTSPLNPIPDLACVAIRARSLSLHFATHLLNYLSF